MLKGFGKSLHSVYFIEEETEAQRQGTTGTKTTSPASPQEPTTEKESPTQP
jgi:hypothetical protein